MKKVIVLFGIILLGYAFNEFSPFEKKLITNFTAQIRELQQEKVYLHTDKKRVHGGGISCGSGLTGYMRLRCFPWFIVTISMSI